MHLKVDEYNNFGEGRLILAWFLSLIGFIRGNYNFNETLRLVSLLEMRASEDINLFNFYKKQYAFEKDIQNNKLFGQSLQHINFSRIFLKHIVRKET